MHPGENICDIGPCGIGGRNYPFNIQDLEGNNAPADYTDTFIGIGGGIKYVMKAMEEVNHDTPGTFANAPTLENFLAFSDGLQLKGDNDDENRDSNAFNSLFVAATMEALMIKTMEKPGDDAFDDWVSGYVTEWNRTNEVKNSYLPVLELSSTRVELHVYASDMELAGGSDVGLLADFVNFNKEMLTAGDIKIDIDQGDEASQILKKIKDLKVSYDTRLALWKRIIDSIDGSSTLVGDDKIQRDQHCQQQYGLNPADIDFDSNCNQQFKDHDSMRKCRAQDGTLGDCEDSTFKLRILATGGLRNHVESSTKLMKALLDTDDNTLSGKIDVENSEILSGSEEAIYGFRAVNIVNALSKTDHRNVADFGGQSVQITKVVDDEIDYKAYSNDRAIEVPDADHLVDIYALSINGIGSNAAQAHVDKRYPSRPCKLNSESKGVNDKDACLAAIKELVVPKWPGEASGSSATSMLGFPMLMSCLFVYLM